MARLLRRTKAPPPIPQIQMYGLWTSAPITLGGCSEPCTMQCIQRHYPKFDVGAVTFDAMLLVELIDSALFVTLYEHNRASWDAPMFTQRRVESAQDINRGTIRAANGVLVVGNQEAQAQFLGIIAADPEIHHTDIKDHQ
ncbi:MAG: hypothetical protein AAFO91_05735 [Bacteroidota bacterium]